MADENKCDYHADSPGWDACSEDRPCRAKHLDPDNIYLMGDQPTTCPKCGCRTEFDEFMYSEDQRQFIHFCLNQDCRFSFYEEEDPEDED